MANFYDKHKSDIKEYCDRNNLDFNKLEKMGRCFGSSAIYFQYFDKENRSLGLLDETPAPIVLIVKEEAGILLIEQTENTERYLSKR